MSLSEKAEFLGQLEIFTDLEEEELLEIAEIADEYEFDDQAIIAYQRDVADAFIIVRSGRLFAKQIDSQGVVLDSRSYFAGQYFEDFWLFIPHTYQYTVRGAGQGQILRIDRKKFLALLEEYNYLPDFLRLSPEAEEVVAGMEFGQSDKQTANLNLLTDERIRYRERRSLWLLVLQLAGPLILFFIWTLILVFALNAGRTMAILGVILPAILLVLYTIWRTLDWANDYFVITDKQLIHHEYNLRGFQVRINKVPVDQVQSVEIERPSLIATILNIGTARVTTAASKGALRFDNVDNPHKILDTINALREQKKAVSAGQAQVDMRTALEKHFEAQPALRKSEEPLDEEVDDEFTSESYSLIDLVLDGLRGLAGFLRRAISTRIEEGEVITYRKHPFTLLTRTWWVLLISLGLLIGLNYVSGQVFSVILGGLWFLSVSLFIWRYLDWRNDLFQLTDRYVFDIDRLPFGFGESRKQAELGNIQNINSERPGLIATIFNYGNVFIETAGASADITFERVANPSLIQNDIFQRRETFKQRQAEGTLAGRRNEFAVMIDVYHQAQQAGRVPDRVITDEVD